MVQAPDLLELGVCKSGDLDEAYARQLIYGGDLELNLLELRAVSEAGLLSALAKATGRPVSSGGPLPVEREISDKVRAVLPEAVAGFAEDRTVIISLPGSPTNEEEGSLLAACQEWQGLVQVTTTLRLLEAQALLGASVLDGRVQSQLRQTGQTGPAGACGVPRRPSSRRDEQSGRQQPVGARKIGESGGPAWWPGPALHRHDDGTNPGAGEQRR
jgi:hypothetical protein